MLEYIKSRLQRGSSLAVIGPNEARLLFDLLITLFAAAAASIFCYIFIPIETNWFAVSLFPALVLLFNTALGLYSRFRTATGRIKAILLVTAVAAAAVAAYFLTIEVPILVMSSILAAPLLALPRLLLNLPYTKHKGLVVKAVRQRGPVLVIGGAGYIGSHVVDQLLKEGQAVRVLDRLMYGRESLASFEGNRNFEFFEGDATDITKLTTAMKGASGVVHLAGLVGDPACAVDPNFTRHTNIIATRMAKDVASSLGIYRFVFASSCSVYGCSDQEVSELDDLNPVSLYAQTKIDSERELLFSVKDDFFVTILRFATVFGHSRRPRFDLVANLFTAQALTDGVITVMGPEQWRPFIHVADLARSIVTVLHANPAIVQSQIYNVGDKRLNMTILDLANRVQAIVSEVRPVTVTVKDDVADRRNYAVSFEKIRKTLGFEAKILIDEGIRELVKEFQKGAYENYKNELYSNVAMTKRSLTYFRDPIQMQRLYAPLQEAAG